MRDEKLVEWTEKIDNIRESYEDKRGTSEEGIYTYQEAIEDPRYPEDMGDTAFLQNALVESVSRLADVLIEKDLIKEEEFLPREAFNRWKRDHQKWVDPNFEYLDAVEKKIKVEIEDRGTTASEFLEEYTEVKA